MAQSCAAVQQEMNGRGGNIGGLDVTMGRWVVTVEGGGLDYHEEQYPVSHLWITVAPTRVSIVSLPPKPSHLAASQLLNL